MLVLIQAGGGRTNWSLEWWSWPMDVIQRQLAIADQFNNASLDELDERNQLPVIRALVNCYQEMVRNTP